VLVGAVTRMRKSLRLCGREQTDISDPTRLDPVLFRHAASLDPEQFGRVSVLSDTRAARCADTARPQRRNTRTEEAPRLGQRGLGAGRACG
jgi:hypothetical protein